MSTPANKQHRATFVKSAVDAAGFIRDERSAVAFVGRSNVGKSSLLNKLLGQTGLARVSSWPGRTQAVNYFLLDETVWFVDLPGYGYAKASKDARKQWAALLESYFSELGAKTTVVQLVDAVVGATPLDVEAFSYLQPLVARQVLVATKIDKLSRGKRAAAFTAIRQALDLNEDTHLIPFSAHSGEGVRELWREITRGDRPVAAAAPTDALSAAPRAL